MDRSQFSVSWEAHQKSICNGLSALQQRGEFVDMTLAADGHHVRVHKMVMSLVSPYIKELINTADCAHPVIFLNQVSYNTLCSILEYVYTGEVLVPRDNINDFISAGKALHIRGLINMHMTTTLPREAGFIQIHNKESQKIDGKEDVTMRNVKKKDTRNSSTPPPQDIHEVYIEEDIIEDTAMDTVMDAPMDNTFDDVLENDVEAANCQVEQEATREKEQEHEQEPEKEQVQEPEQEQVREQTQEQEREQGRELPSLPRITRSSSNSPIDPYKTACIQYSVSNQGNIQILLNRYLYYLVYSGRTSGHRRWQCIDNHRKKMNCPAAVITRNDVIVQRISAHNHPFHDVKILKKAKSGLIFSALQAAEDLGKKMQDERSARSSTVAPDKNGDSDSKQ